MARMLAVDSRQKSTRETTDATDEISASAISATPATTSGQGWRRTARPAEAHCDILSTFDAHFGGGLGARGPARRRRRSITAKASRSTPIRTVAADTPRPGREWARGAWPPVTTKVLTTSATRQATHPAI